MKVTQILRGWKTILAGRTPFLSVELTKECPLSCPGCYAYGDEHLGGNVRLTQVSDFKGKELVNRFMDLIDRYMPLHVSIVGGEPLVRFRELNEILPQQAARGVITQLVTSAVRPIPIEWRSIKLLTIVVSIDGLA
ncbi:MAG: radical SAM protein, partial [Acidobacteria bacterium]